MSLNEFQRAFLKNELVSKLNVIDPTTGEPLDWDNLAGGLTEPQVQALIDAAVANLVNGAPGALNTLEELADALGDDANFAASVTTALAGKSATSHGHTHAATTGQTANDHHAQAHHAAHEPSGADPLAVDAAAGTGSLRTLGTGAAQATAGNDGRLSDSRTPTAHAASHKSGGSDSFAGVQNGFAALDSGLLVPIANLPVGTGASQVAAGNHTHALTRTEYTLSGDVTMGAGDAFSDGPTTSSAPAAGVYDVAARVVFAAVSAAQMYFVARLIANGGVIDEVEGQWVMANTSQMPLYLFARVTADGTNPILVRGASSNASQLMKRDPRDASSGLHRATLLALTRIS